MKYPIVGLLLSLAALQASAFAWKAKPIEAEKAALVKYLQTAQALPDVTGRSASQFAAELVAQTNTTAWMQAAIDYGTALLGKCEGRDAADPVRRAALEIIDYPLHVDNYGKTIKPEEMAAFNEMVVSYARLARDRVLAEVESAKVPEGELWFWRIYNMSFLVKGPRHTVAFDLTTRPELIAKPLPELMKEFSAAYKAGKAPKLFDIHAGAPAIWTETEWKKVAAMVDVAVLTHPHGDHTSEPFLREMMRLGKPIVLPGDVSTRVPVEGQPMGRLVPFTTGASCVKLLEDHAEPVDVGGIGVRNFMGFQSNVPCNVYILEIDGIRVVNNGDNSNRAKEKLLMNMPPADVVIAATWNQVHHILGCVQKAPGFDGSRAVLIPAHENELGHSVDHRESYLEMYTDPKRLGKPVFPLTRTFPLGWGECLKYRASAK